jgi:hypothetical protein
LWSGYFVRGREDVDFSHEADIAGFRSEDIAEMFAVAVGRVRKSQAHNRTPK